MLSRDASAPTTSRVAQYTITGCCACGPADVVEKPTSYALPVIVLVVLVLAAAGMTHFKKGPCAPKQPKVQHGGGIYATGGLEVASDL